MNKIKNAQSIKIIDAKTNEVVADFSAKMTHFECGGEFDVKDVIFKGSYEYETGTEHVFDCPCCHKETDTLNCG